MNYLSKLVGVVVVALALATSLALTASAGSAQANGEAYRKAHPAPAPASALAGGETSIESAGSPANTQALPCRFYTKGDLVHKSGSQASGHGWWLKGSCNANRAVVTVQLQEYYSDGSWRNKGTKGKKTVGPGGGRGKRATGRAACSNSRLTGWRSVVDVDLVGVRDSPNKLYTRLQNIYCRRY